MQEELIEFSHRLDVECKKTKKVKDDSDNIYWRSWKRGVDIYCDGRRLRDVREDLGIRSSIMDILILQC